MLNTFFKKKIKFFFNNIPKGYLKSYLEKKFYKLDFYSSNVINLKKNKRNYKKRKNILTIFSENLKKDHNLDFK